MEREALLLSSMLRQGCHEVPGAWCKRGSNVVATRGAARRRCQEFCVLRSVKKSQLIATVNRSPNRMAN
jgi:hypothetical protein